MNMLSGLAARTFLGLASVSVVATASAAPATRLSLFRPILVVLTLSLAVAMTWHRRWRENSFTVWILAGVALGMSYPQYFVQSGDFKYTRLFVPILQVIMFGMGTTLSIADFQRVVKIPVAVLVGALCQFTIMPLVGWGLAHASGLPPEIGAGLVLVGTSPSGLASNVMSYIAKADVALSVTLTTVCTLLAPIMTPLLMYALAGEMINVNVTEMMWSIAKIVLFPVIAGLIFHHTIYHRARWLDVLMPRVSMIGIFVMTVLTVAPGRDNLLQMGSILIGMCFVHCVAGFLLGYLACRALRMDRVTSRTISLEVGLQNAGLASGLAAQLGRVATLGLAPIVFGPVMNITASMLANWWRNHPVSIESHASSPQFRSKSGNGANDTIGGGGA